MEEERIRELLTGRRRELESLRDGLRPSTDEQGDLAALSSADQHPADTGTELSDRTAALALLEQIEAELRDLEDAGRRLEAGVYGHCEVCGREIPDERLQAEPATRWCIDHAGSNEVPGGPGARGGSAPL
jgi:RNA polymerase-binding transcription factor DksA